MKHTISNELSIIWFSEISQMTDTNKNRITRMLSDIDHEYEKEGRYYHSYDRTMEMLENFRVLFNDYSLYKVQHQIITTAIIFHDVIYNSWSSNNKIINAEYAKAFLSLILSNIVGRPNYAYIIDMVQRCVLLTETFKFSNEHDICEQIVCDLAMAIYADMDTEAKRKRITDSLRYEQFLVDDRIYVQKRIDELKQLVNQRIYHTEKLFKYEVFAHENIKENILELKRILENK